MDRGAWWAKIQRVANNQTRLRTEVKKKEKKRADENAQGSQNPAGSKPKPKVGVVGGGQELESKSGKTLRRR